MQEGLFRDSFGCFDNRSGPDAEVVDEFVRLPAVRDRANGELMHLDAFGPDRTEHRIAEATMRIMILDGEEPALRSPGTVQERRAVDRNDTIEIDDPDEDTGSF